MIFFTYDRILLFIMIITVYLRQTEQNVIINNWVTDTALEDLKREVQRRFI